MKSKNLMFAGALVLGILVIGVIAAAGITGYQIRLFKGQKATLPDGSTLERTAKNDFVVTPSAGSSGSSSSATGHTHLSDYSIFGMNTKTFLRQGNAVYANIQCYQEAPRAISWGVDMRFNQGFAKTKQSPFLWKSVTTFGSIDTVSIEYFDPDQVLSISGNESSWAYVYCAKEEPTLHTFGQDN